MATTLERFQEVLKPIINIENDKQTSLRSMHLDALDLVQLIADLEDEFEIEIEDTAAEHFSTVGDVVRYIDGCLSKKGNS